MSFLRLDIVHLRRAGGVEVRDPRVREGRASVCGGQYSGHCDEADEALRAALKVAERIEYPPVIWRALAVGGELARRRGNASDAQEKFERARALVDDKARSLDDSGLRSEFRGLGERLMMDPVETFR